MWPTRPEWGFTAMPLIDDDNVILVPGGKEGDLVALDKKTGKLVWRSKELTDNIHYSSPILAEIGGVRQIIVLTEKSVAGICAADGHLLCARLRKGSTAVIPTPICHDDCVYVTSGYEAGCNLFKIASEGANFSATQVYANKTMTNHHGGVILVGKELYGFSDGKGWICQNFATGRSGGSKARSAKAHWSTPTVCFTCGRKAAEERSLSSRPVLMDTRN